jgi:hypothetical protein
MARIVESVSLHYTDGGRSDKVYNINIEEVGPNQYDVTGYNGKRGGTLTPRKQNDSPVSLTEARRLFAKIEQQKVNHRTTPYVVLSRNGATAPPTAQPSSPTTNHEATGFVANHPKKVSEDEALRLLNNDDYFVEQKCDGEFMSALYRLNRVTASNKRGTGIPVPPKIATAIRQLASLACCETLGLAGEYLDSTLHIFTVWEKNGTSLMTLPQHLRVAVKEKLEQALAEQLAASTSRQSTSLKFVYTAKTQSDKTVLYETIKANAGEGVVFKHRESDVSFKYKLYETTEVLLVANSKRSAECFAYHDGTLTSLGSVTIPHDATHQEIKNANLRKQPVVASVKYLYLSAPPAIGPTCGQLTQASFLRFRPEVDEHSCLTTELKVVNKSVLSIATDPST